MNEDKNKNELAARDPNLSAMTERVVGSVRSHQRKMRVLTATTFLFGILAIATSTALVWSYLFLVLPKQKQMLQEAEYPVLKKQVGTAAEPPAIEEAVRRLDGKLNIQVVMTHVISVGVSILCIAVGVLGLGTVVLMAVVMLQRRATLNQISASLADISRQLKQLQQPGSQS